MRRPCEQEYGRAPPEAEREGVWPEQVWEWRGLGGLGRGVNGGRRERRKLGRKMAWIEDGEMRGREGCG
jgi:hypothetical protein